MQNFIDSVVENKYHRTPEDISNVHDEEFRVEDYQDAIDIPYFRLLHSLTNLSKQNLPT